MPVFAWRTEPSRHFGQQQVPFASVTIKTAAERWHAFSLVVDSGAVISLLCRSVGELLGVPIEEGRRVTLTGVGRRENEVFVHELLTRIGDGPPRPTRFAISMREDVPNLLGRLDVFDNYQVDFDPSLQETRITAPRHFLDVEQEILSKWREHSLPESVDEAARRFVNRSHQLVEAGAGLLKLGRDYELPLIIRSLFELSVQFEFLMLDPMTRAQLYLDYEHVTKYRSEQAWLKLPGFVGDALRASPDRPAGEARNLAEYQRVRDQYAGKNKSDKDRLHWYPGNLRQLAEKVNRAEEYDAIYRLYSAWAHGDPWTAQLTSVAGRSILHFLAYWARLLIQVADAKKIILTGEAYESLRLLAKGPVGR